MSEIETFGMRRRLRGGKAARSLLTRRGGAIAKAVVLLAVLAAMGGAAVYAVRNADDGGVAAAADLFLAEVRDFTISTTASGELQAKNRTEVSNPLDTRASITYIVDEGTIVEKGDVLIELATEELDQRLLDAERNVISARNSLIVAENSLAIQKSDNESSVRKAELELALAELELQKWKLGDVLVKKTQLDLALEKAGRELDRLKIKYEMSIKLHDKDFISDDELRQDEIAVLEAEANLATAQIEKTVYRDYTYLKEEKQKNSDVSEAVANLARVQSTNATQLKTKEADVAYNTTLVAKREEELKEIQQQIAASTIKAPTGGLVVYSTSLGDNRWDNDGPLQVGREVRPNEELIVLPDTSEMMAYVKVHESLISKVHEGQRAIVTIDALNSRTVDGVVETIGVMAQSGGWRDPNNREYEVKIALDAGELIGRLKPAMRCESEIILDAAVQALTVPAQAVFHEGQVAFVYLAAGEQFKRCPVAVGRRSNDYAEILAGLDSGQAVLLRRPRPNEVSDDQMDEAAVQDVMQVAAQFREAQRQRRAALAEQGREYAPDQPQDAANIVPAKESAAEQTSQQAKQSLQPAAVKPAEQKTGTTTATAAAAPVTTQATQ